GDVPPRGRRDRSADEPRAVRRREERDRALPDRRHPDLDPEGRAVQVARGGPDREGPGSDRPARRAHRVRDRAGAVERTRACCGGRGGAELMESASVAVGHAEEHHPPPPEANQSSRIDRQTLGILLFIVSEVMLFGAFFASYFFLRVVANEGP